MQGTPVSGREERDALYGTAHITATCSEFQVSLIIYHRKAACAGPLCLTAILGSSSITFVITDQEIFNPNSLVMLHYTCIRV